MKRIIRLIEGTLTYRNIEYHINNKEMIKKNYSENTYAIW